MKKLFECEICGKIHDDEQKAKQCERSHKIPTEVTPLAYGKESEYPYKIKVKFGNVKAVYRYESRLGVCSYEDNN